MENVNNYNFKKTTHFKIKYFLTQYYNNYFNNLLFYSGHIFYVNA